MRRHVIKGKLLAGLSALAFCASAAGAEEQENGGAETADGAGQIVVSGYRTTDLFAGIQVTDELNENDIAAYGFDTVGEVLDQVRREVDDNRDGPVVLINGQLTNGIADVSDLPTEAVTKIQVLPIGAGARVGQSASRRVINVVIKPNLRQVTGNVSGRTSTRGDAVALDAEANFLRLNEGNRATLVLRARHVDPLLESDRNIVPDTSGLPFDLVGNVIPVGTPGDQIDPLLSALAGKAVTVVGVQATSQAPTLTSFVTRANVANISDLASFRTLTGETESYSANANLTRRLNQVTTVSLTGRFEQTYGQTLNGAATASFLVPVGSPFSPFSRDVRIARAFDTPLRQDTSGTNLFLSQTLNSRVGKYAVSVLANFNHRAAQTESDRNFDLTKVQTGISGGTVNPFAPIDPALLGFLRQDLARSKSDNGQVQAVASGSLFQLPAGPATFAATLGWRRDRLSSRTQGANFSSNRTFSQSERNAQLNISLPLLGGEFGDTLGQLTADLSTALRDISGTPTVYDYGGALDWNPLDALNLRLSWASEETAPPTSALNDPQVVVENFRTFDFVRQETVLVRYITGGNPDLPIQKRTRTNVSATLRPLGDYGLTINAEYERQIGRNAFAALPPADARVQLAFFDRYIRDANGTLIQLDARPIYFERDTSELFRWGIDFKRTYNGTVGAGEAEGVEPASGVSAGRGWRVNFNATHTWYLENSRLIRAGLPIVDLLNGGAAGFAGGQPRHFVRVGGGVYHAGIGLQFDADYRSGSSIDAGSLTAPDEIRFAERTLVNLRGFVNLGPKFPDSGLAKGARVSLSIANLLDSKQRVTDGSNATPLRYQPFLLDPLGRTVTLSLRKVF